MPLRNRNIWHASTPNPSWAAVETYAQHHTHPPARPNTAALTSTARHSRAAGLPDYAVSPSQGKFLALHCRTAGVTHALEVGTLGGYAAVWLASENPGLKLVTIERDPHHAAVARENLAAAGLLKGVSSPEGRVEVVEGAALEVLSRLREEVQAGKRERFGFVFIDADKVNNWRYFQLARDMLRPNSVICVDNVVREGDLADLQNDDPYVEGCREVVEKAGREPGVDAVVVQTVSDKSYDGWLWAVVS
ncbi:S-adenosyl-L-methionine-dependent methyltransferase [Chaetomium sp. MPI-SDFR-AT-0129]|nr:S-adenosyl-L-methionine-dependent methyltransferase [Chaetomium sp. MPI-SDFR-AT-0129]